MSGYDEGWRQQQIEIERLKGRVEQVTPIEIDPLDPSTVPDSMLTREAVAQLLAAHKALTATLGEAQESLADARQVIALQWEQIQRLRTKGGDDID